MKTSVPIPERVAIRSLYLDRRMTIGEIAMHTGYTKRAVSTALMSTNAYGSPRGR